MRPLIYTADTADTKTGASRSGSKFWNWTTKNWTLKSTIQLQFIHCDEAIYTAADAAAIFINPKARVQIQLLVL